MSIEVYERMPADYCGQIDDSIVLDHEQRAKGRLKTVSAAGEEVRMFLERGKSLAIGTVLRSRCNRFVEIKGAQEQVALARAADWLTFSEACYHLGNRHVRLQLGEKWLCIKPDHVLEAMLKQLGLSVEHSRLVFDPVHGAYAKHEH